MLFKPVHNGNRKRYSYARIKEVLKMPHLIDLQRKSYEWFIREGLHDAFQDVSPIKDATNSLELSFENFTIGDPKYDIETCKEKDATYAAPLNVDVRLLYKDTGEIKESTVFMGDFPLMTDTGTFVINGAERVIVSQLVRSPGVYYAKDMDPMGKFLYGTTVIPNRGAWIEYETDLNSIIYARVDRTRKLSATALLRVMGLPTNDDIISVFGEHPYLVATLAKDTTKNEDDALLEIYRKLRPGEPANLENAEQLIYNLFSDNRRYDLANVGRYKINKKLGWRHRLHGKTLAEDLCAENPDGTKGAVVLPAGTKIGDAEIDTIEKSGIFADEGYAIVYVKFQEHAERMIVTKDIEASVRTITPADVIASFGYLLNVIDGMEGKDDIDHLGNRRVRCVGELLQNQFRIGLSRMERVIRERMTIQDADVITPQALINIRPVVAAVKEFFGSSQLSQFMDQNNPLAELTHKRRLSALGPGGLSRERAGYEVRDVHPSHYGRMCPIETPEGPNIGLIGSLAAYGVINRYGFIETPYRKVDKVNKRVTDEIVYLTADEEDNYVVAQANEPLTEDNHFVNTHVTCRDKNEVLAIPPERVDFMDVSPKQVMSIAAALIPFLENDDANRALMGANMQRQAVPLLQPHSPYVGTGVEFKIAKDSGVGIVARENGVVEYVDSQRIIVSENDGNRREYRLRKFQRSNNGTNINQSPIISKGERIEKGDILADGPSMERGELALGQNVTIAYMTWYGYNYEDAIIMSERLVRDDVYTSIHIEEYDIDCRETKLGPEEITRDIPNVSENACRNLDSRGIIMVGAEVMEGDILVGKVTPKGQSEISPEEKLLLAIFGEKSREVRDNSLKVPHGGAGIVHSIRVFKRSEGHDLPPGVNETVKVYIVQKRKISEGDKMAGRHGNKGVISKILPVEDMPYMPDGTPVDIMLNPFGVPSRMNIGQVLEIHLGYAAKKLGVKFSTPVFDGINNTELSDIMKEAEMTVDGKQVLYDGRTGEPFDERISVGVMYMIKLAHMVDDKLHARATGPYSLVTQQPLGGKAQNGGQRFGEMEVWALEAYGAAHTLQEILTVKSDDIVGRTKTYEAIIKGKDIPEPGIPESFRVLKHELQALAIDVKMLDEDGNEVDISKEDNSEAAATLPPIPAAEPVGEEDINDLEVEEEDAVADDESEDEILLDDDAEADDFIEDEDIELSDDENEEEA